MEFRILGHFEVLRDGQRLELGGPKQRSVLAALVIEGGRVVSIGRLSDHLWAGQPSAGRDGTVHAYVSRLRRVLEPDRVPGASGQVLVSRGSGYLLDIDQDQLDAGRFERLAEQGRQALFAGHFEEAEELLSAGLALWRGQALADFVFEPFAEAVAARLEERRVELLEDRIDVALARGRHGVAVAELEQLVSVHRFRERLRGRLMLALYRSGRQAEALRSYEVARRLLRDELGTEPGPALKALEQAILRQDPTLDWRSGGDGAAAPVSGAARGEAGPRLTRRATPAVFVGRVSELAALEAALGDTRSGCSRVVLVAGAPGAGKTRLAEELAVRAAQAGVGVVWGHCCEADGAPALWPWVQIIRTLVDAGDPAVLHDALATEAGVLGRIVPEIAEAVPGLEPPDFLRPEETRIRLFEAVTGFLSRLATRRPLVLILDDLHWADADSLEIVRLWSSRPPAGPVLLVGCYRDSDVVPGSHLAETLDGLGSEPRVTRLVLEGLGRDDVARFMAQVLGWKPKRGLVNAIHDRTEGNPFFVAELTRLVRDKPLSDNAANALLRRVPAGVRDVIYSRLTRLPEAARQLLETATVFGREFDLGLVARVTGVEPKRTAQLAATILASRMIAANPDGSGRYRFSPSLIREALYDGLPALRRVRLHRRAAEVLEEIDGPSGAGCVEIAHHFWEAARGGAGEQAFEAALRASDWAASRAAYEQAEEQLVRASEVVHRLPPGPGRDQRELALQLRLSTLLSIRRGYGAPQVGHACHRAGELCGLVGDPDELLWSLIRLGAFYSVRLHSAAAQRVGDLLLEAARDSGDERFLIAGHLRLGVTAFHEGQLAKAKGHLGRVTTCLRTVHDSSLGEVFVEHPAVKAYGYRALIHWLEGDDRAATVLTNQGLGLARRLHDPYTLGFGLFLAAWAAASRGQRAAVRQRAGELRVLADERGFRLLAASAQVLTGWACAEQGEAEEGVALAEDGLAALAATEGRMMRPFFLSLLARAYRRAGRLEDGLRTLAEALAEVEAAGERFAEAELHRLQGEFLAAFSPHRRADAEIALFRALSVAQSQGAVALERRALTSATRLANDRASSDQVGRRRQVRARSASAVAPRVSPPQVMATLP